MRTSLFGFFVLTMTSALLAGPEAGIKSGSFDSAGVKIAYIEAGEGPPVILIHGLDSSAQMNWVLPGIFKMLTEHCHVIALDLRGHGDSDRPISEDAYGQPMVDDIINLMDHLKIEKAHIAGYSLGGIIAMKLAVDHPDRVLSANLGGMGWLRQGSELAKVFGRLGGRAASKTPPAAVHGMAKLGVTEDQIKAVKTPLEMLVGDRDPCRKLYVEPAEAVRNDWPAIVIQDAGHITCVTKEQYKDELKKWIDKNAKQDHAARSG